MGLAEELTNLLTGSIRPVRRRRAAPQDTLYQRRLGEVVDLPKRKLEFTRFHLTQ